MPDDYRRAYQLLGSWAIAADGGRGSKELHVVYASPGAINSYRKNKRFPDGAVLIKEVFKTATNEMTTGTVSRADALKGWFVMVKDSTNRYPGNSLWGDGWGWSWFDADNSTQDNVHRLQTELQILPRAGACNGLDLRRWIPAVETLTTLPSVASQQTKIKQSKE